MIVPRFTSFTKDFVIRSYEITKIFRSGRDCTGASSTRSPLAISVLGEVNKDAVLSRYPL